MKPIKLIKSFTLKHKTTGLEISPYGTLPYGESEDWERVEKGYTTQNDDGTIGMGRIPFKTLQEASAKYPQLAEKALRLEEVEKTRLKLKMISTVLIHTDENKIRWIKGNDKEAAK